MTTTVDSEKKVAHIRRDLKFRVEVEELDYHQISYNIHDLLVRVERGYSEDREIRYGVLVDFEEEGSLLHDTYILEIPTRETEPKKIQEAQEKLIHDYVMEMRGKWDGFYSDATRAEGLLTDEYDRLQRFTGSTDGRWQILRSFRTGTVTPKPGDNQFTDDGDREEDLFTNFIEWLTLRELQEGRVAPGDEEKLFVHYRMPFQVGEEYEIYVDWTIPYICFEHGHMVNHFKSDTGGAEQLFFPFHNFQWQKVGSGKTLTVDATRKYGSGGGIAVKVPPTNYAYLAYWTFVIEEIDRLQKENMTALRPYFIYLSNLSHIQALVLRDGPLKGMGGEEIEQLSRLKEDGWDGGVSDDMWGVEEHKSQLALGFMDLTEIRNLFAALIAEEAKGGRNANRATNISYLGHVLSRAWDAQLTSELYEDLWTHNRDKCGTDLFLTKAALLIARSEDGEDAYDKFFKKNVFEHPALEQAIDNPSVWPDVMEWGNMAYRSASMLTEIWSAFYSTRESKLLFDLEDEIAKGTRFADEIMKWFNQSIPSYDPSVKISWKLRDRGVRNLVNFLIGGQQGDEVRKLEAKITVGIKQILGPTPRLGLPSYEEVAKIREISRKAKTEFLTEADPKIGKPGVKGPVITTAINLLIAGAAYYSYKDSEQDSEATLRALTVALGAGIDVVETIALMRGVQATLNKAVAARAGSVVVQRVALGVGSAKAIGGGVGGAIGVVWSAYDAYCGFSSGRSKDGVLDTISAIGAAITVVGLFLDGTILGLPAGVVCNVVGIAIVLIAQAVKYFRLWSGKTEDLVKSLYTNSLEKGGMDRMSHWYAEYAGEEDEAKGIKRAVYPWTSAADMKAVGDLTDRVHAFLQDWDTFETYE